MPRKLRNNVSTSSIVQRQQFEVRARYGATSNGKFDLEQKQEINITACLRFFVVDGGRGGGDVNHGSEIVDITRAL